MPDWTDSDTTMAAVRAQLFMERFDLPSATHLLERGGAVASHAIRSVLSASDVGGTNDLSGFTKALMATFEVADLGPGEVAEYVYRRLDTIVGRPLVHLIAIQHAAGETVTETFARRAKAMGR